MAYIDLATLRAYLDITGTSDDPLLEACLDGAQAYIEAQTNRRFESYTATRYYTRRALDPDNKFLLLVDQDLLAITTLTNGDSSSTVIPATEYVLWPRNETPKFGVLLETNSTYSWEWDTDYYVSIAGTWGYGTSVPNDIQMAARAMAAYLYRQKDAQMFETTAILESGALAVPQGIPATVTRIISRYRRYM